MNFGYQILGFGAHTSGEIVSGADLKTSLAAWWGMDETSGTRADSHTNGYTLADFNTVESTDGKVGAKSALFVTAEGTSLERTNAVEAWRINTNDFTVAFWIKFTAFDTGAIQSIIGCGATANTTEGWTTNVLDDGSGMQVKTSNGISRVNHLFDFDTTLSTGIWYFIIVEWDRDGDVAVWKNNIKESVTTDISSLSSDDILSDVDLKLGRKPGFATLGLKAAVDELPIWNRLLTSGEKTWLYNDNSGRAYSELG